MRKFYMVTKLIDLRKSLKIGGKAIGELSNDYEGPPFVCPVFLSREEAEQWASGGAGVLEFIIAEDGEYGYTPIQGSWQKN